MYYEETIVNGVLCFRTTPHTPFVECSKEKLTAKIQELDQKLKLYRESEAENHNVTSDKYKNAMDSIFRLRGRV